MKRLWEEKQIVKVAEEYNSTTMTIRELSQKYCICRATLHRYFTMDLKTIAPTLAVEVKNTASCKKYEGTKKGGKNHGRKKE